MKRKILFILFFATLIVFSQKSFARIEIQTICYQVCVKDNFDDHWTCVVHCDEQVIIIEENNGDNGGDNGTINPGGSGDSPIEEYDQDNDGVMDCWKDLTMSSRITHKFNEKRNNRCNFHTGTDIGTKKEGGKLPLFNAIWGTVIELGYKSDLGFFIRVKNYNDSYTLYCHLDGDTCTGKPYTNLEVGDEILPGELIGTTDNSGSSHGSHLDIKIYFNGEKSYDEIVNQFPFSVLENNTDSFRYCPYLNRTFLNATKVLNNGNCD